MVTLESHLPETVRHHSPMPGKPQHNVGDEWATPDWLWRPLHWEFRFTVDAAASDANHKLPRYWTQETNGLKQPWQGERVWCNPPYSDVEPWVAKAHEEARIGQFLAVLLVPVRTDREWYHRYCIGPHCERRDINGRIRFDVPKDCDNPMRPFEASMLLIFRWPWWVERACRDRLESAHSQLCLEVTLPDTLPATEETGSTTELAAGAAEGRE